MIINATTLTDFIVDTDAVDSFTFPNLTTIGDQFWMNNCSGQVTLDLHTLTGGALGNGFQVSSNANLTSINLSKFNDDLTNFEFTIQYNNSLVSIDLSSQVMPIAYGDMTISVNSSLTTILFNAGFRFADDGSSYDFSSNAFSAATVNLILHLLVLSAVTGLSVDLSGGTSSPPTGQGIIDAATLVAAGNSITTN